MSIASPLLQRAHGAILASYSRDELRRALMFCFGRDLDALVSQTAYTDQLFELLRRAERSGNLLPMLHCLAEERPNSPELVDIWTAVQCVYDGDEPAPDPDWGSGCAISPPQIAQYEERYLAQVRSECQYVRTGGIGEPKVELTDVFVMLHAVENLRSNRRTDGAKGVDVAPTPRRWAEMGLRDPYTASGQEEAAAHDQSPPPPPPIPLSQAVREKNHVVLLGEPGSGKSTVLQFLTRCYATPGCVRNKLGVEETRVPFLLELSRYDGSQPFGVYLAKRFMESGPFPPIPTDELEQIANVLLSHWLSEKRVIVLLDAFDEVPELQRSTVLQEIERFAATSEGKGCRIVLTSRIAEYSSEVRPGSDFEQYVIHPLDNQRDVLNYIVGWLRVLTPRTAGATLAANLQAENLLEQLQRQPGLQRILSNPLLLRLAITVYLETGKPIHKRAEIYRLYVDEVLWKRSQKHNWFGFSKAQVRHALTCIAWTLQSQPQMRSDEMADRVTSASDGLVDGSRMLEFLQQGMGLLGVHGYAEGELVAFRHATFREFLVGRRLAKKWKENQAETWCFLRHCLHFPAWREPILLMVGLLTETEAIDLIKHVWTAHSPYERELHRDLLFATDLLASSAGTDPEVIQGIVSDVISLTALGSKPAWLLDPKWPGYRRLGGAGIATRMQHSRILTSLGQIGAPVIPHLVPYLFESNYYLVTIAAQALGESGEAAVPQLIKALHDPSETGVLAAAIALGKIGESAVPYLVEALYDSNSYIRAASARGLGETQDPKVIHHLAKALNDSDHFVRFYAIDALCKFGNDAVSQLIVAVSAPNARVREAAARSLGELGAAEAIPCLIEALSDSDTLVHRAAVVALGVIGDAVAVPHLINDLVCSDDGTRWATAAALRRRWDVTAVPHLVEALSDANKTVREVAVWALGETEDTYSTPYIITALFDADDSVRRSAAEALGKRRDGLAVPYLALALHDPGSYVGRSAAAALGRLGDAGVSQLIAALVDPDWTVRWLAAEALGELESAAAAPHLMMTLSDPNDYVRWAAAVGLGKLGYTAAVPHLIDALHTSDNNLGRIWAAAALGKTGDVAAVPHLVNVLSNRHDSARYAAVEALGRLKDPAAIPYLIKALANSDRHIRKDAAEALERIGDATAVPHLIKLLADPNDSVREAAADALARLIKEENRYDSVRLEKWAAKLARLAYHKEEIVRSEAVTLLERIVPQVESRRTTGQSAGGCNDW